jgi:cation diffusion facilitator CzcD-associated flavoprotein CzcO
MGQAASAGPRVVIIGAGMSGILAGYRLRGMGIDDFTIYEKGNCAGGTWRENTYPGLHCDVPSHFYCYSFAPNPDWTKKFSPGNEIREYFERQAEELGVAPHIRLNSEITDAKWDGARWNITLRNGSKDVADIVISATGFLHQIAMPDIAGLDSFAGTKFHTARWDHSVSLEDKRIGIIGTGSTAVQIVSALAGKVKKLELYQRTPQWVLNVPQEEFSQEQREAFRKDPESMRELYDEASELTVNTARAIMGLDPALRAEMEQNCRDNLLRVKDPELRAKLTPAYEVGCKRLVMSPDFYEAIQRESTCLVTEGIDHVEAGGIVTKDGKLHELDVIVIATGFNATAYIRPVTMTGQDGITLDEIWAEQPKSYQCVTVPQMPNFFMIGGPYSPVGNISLVLMAEWQVDYIMKCVRRVAEEHVSLCPTPEVTEAFLRDLREEARGTVWARGGCTSWYLDAEGIPAIYPYPFEHFRDTTLGGPDFDSFDVRPLRQPVEA